MMYALFAGDARISNVYSTKDAVLTEATERKLAYRSTPDFQTGGSNITVSLLAGYSIREVPAPTERISYAAIMLDGVCWTVQRPYRHCDVIRRIVTECPKIKTVPGDAVQGFWTSDNRFVDRREGLRVATAAGQILRRTGNADDQLYSEDVW